MLVIMVRTNRMSSRVLELGPPKTLSPYIYNNLKKALTRIDALGTRPRVKLGEGDESLPGEG